ncbi:DUF2141 domain-containing protein [Winogradskyella luteola]|uniref:DUF2141 domain-containing protein n=1 Tax=Winogradskyella luteola TaxID=2828330 RepID=A0A9X1JNQ1_9FLAO|nr:DUF2141 domain-containing protein [Winogradskyella luteola]MBV7267894.1 DUF2141 domain-containing protein [Winogradskyella luteola]
METLIRITVILIVSFMTCKAQTQESYQLTVKVEKADSNDGQMFIAVYNTEADFLGKSYTGTKSKIADNGCVVTFKNIPEGTYAVSVFHDENDNGKMDTNFLGIPKEDYACSNDAAGFLGPPKWKDAKFELKENTSITITL